VGAELRAAPGEELAARIAGPLHIARETDPPVPSVGLPRSTQRCPVSSCGQGSETVFAQMCSEFFGCDYDAVAVHAGSTTFSPLNTAAFASRTVIAAAGALLEACARLRAKTLRIAAHALEVDDPDALDIVGSAVQHRRDPTLVIPLAAVFDRAPPPTRSGRRPPSSPSTPSPASSTSSDS
jgi:carbon-monoxide dehydrogenase large subunit